MGLRQAAEGAIQAAFRAAGDAATEVLYRTKTQSTYNASTDTQGQTVADTELKVLYDFAATPNNSGDLNTDYNSSGSIKAIMSAKELLPNTPKTEDLIVDTSVSPNIIYKIKGIEPIGPFSEAVGYTLTLVKDSG